MLTKMDIDALGGWAPQVDGNLRWNGEVRCDRSFVALLVGSANGHLHWAKTELCEPRSLLVLTLHPLRPPLGTQLMFHVGNGFLTNMVAAIEPSARAVTIRLPSRGEAGVLHDLFVVPSESPATLGVLLLAREDVRLGRTGVWRPKAAVSEELPEALHVALEGARKGDVEIVRT
ncbi:MAG TPA: hypothetical protein VK989_17155 [Polyangia bacterium]|jgi:hypothetical protein|nr:hypothetical protein [Polyangia bacterium]